jgi:hypothetical protein
MCFVLSEVTQAGSVAESGQMCSSIVSISRDFFWTCYDGVAPLKIGLLKFNKFFFPVFMNK